MKLIIERVYCGFTVSESKFMDIMMEVQHQAEKHGAGAVPESLHLEI